MENVEVMEKIYSEKNRQLKIYIEIVEKYIE